MSKAKALQPYRQAGSFDEAANAAMIKVTTRSDHTRAAYANDLRRWSDFCGERGIDPKDPPELAVEGWDEQMKLDGVSPKTRARRVASLCSIYRQLRKTRKDADGNPRKPIVTHNPFSIEDGPARSRALAVKPTPIASPASIAKMLKTCDESEMGIRDAAIIRILWGTGARRASLIGMTFERLQTERGEYIANLFGKGGKDLRVLIRGRAAEDLRRWIEVLKKSGLAKGALWRGKLAPLTNRALGHPALRPQELARPRSLRAHARDRRNRGVIAKPRA